MKMRTRMAALLIFGISLQFSFHSAIGAVNCACTAKDSQANSKCGPKPDKIQNITSKLEHCESCDSVKDVQYSTSANFAQNTLNLLESSKKLKDTKELFNYISCYRPSDQKYCHYKKTLSPYIGLASESSGLPMAVQSCLFLRESGFNANAKSERGAIGYIQFMPTTVTLMNSIVKGTVIGWLNENKKAQDLIKFYEKKKDDTPKPSRSLLIKYFKNINYLKATIKINTAKIAAKKTWERYWEGTKKRPTAIDQKSVKCPQVAFVLSAMKQIFDLGLLWDFDVKSESTHTQSFSINGLDLHDSSILLAGTYNAGVSGLGSRCGEVKSLQECIRLFEKGHETRNYMTSIQTCSKKGATDPMVGMVKRNCEAFKCEK